MQTPIAPIAPPPSERLLSPFTVRVLNELDEEIDRLSRARAVLLAAVTAPLNNDWGAFRSGRP